ncbi:MAG: hypothetical protein AB2A00_25370 [Myxococcota bacterium]
MVVGLLVVALLIVCGLLGASGFIVSKKPDAKQLLEKLVPYQGGAGIAGIVVGLLGLVNMLMNLGALLKHSVGGLVIGLVGSASLIGTGFLLGFALIQGFNKDPNARAKAEELRTKLVTYQVPMGMVCIVLGVLNLVFML